MTTITAILWTFEIFTVIECANITSGTRAASALRVQDDLGGGECLDVFVYKRRRIDLNQLSIINYHFNKIL